MGVRNRFAAAAAAQLILLAFCSAASASSDCAGDSIQPTTAAANDAAMALVCDVNQFRARHGLAPLRWDTRLASAAQRHADDMATRHYFAHVSPDGQDFVDWVRPTGYIPSGGAWSLAENIGFGTNLLSAPSAIAGSWMTSSAHRRNMLDAQMRDIGVGLAGGVLNAGDQQGTFYVAEFAARGKHAATARRARHRRACTAHKRQRVAHRKRCRPRARV